MADNTDELDQLLDSALDDFQNLNLTSTSTRDAGKKDNEKEDDCVPCEVKGLGVGLPNLQAKKKKKGKQMVRKESYAAEALKKLREQTVEAVTGLEAMAETKPSANGFVSDSMMDDWVKQFEDLAGSQGMESMMEVMVQQLLSKEVLHEPMKELRDKYPDWLNKHKNQLSIDDHKRFTRQHELIKQLIQVYENDSHNFTEIVKLLQKMQECGQPPDDIINLLAPDFDVSTLGHLIPETTENTNAEQQTAGCCIM